MNKIALVALAILAAGQCWAADAASQPGADLKLVNDLFGKRMAEVMATPDGGDNMTLAGEMLKAAGDTANSVNLRALLAVEAAKVATPVGSKEANDLIRKALALSDSLKPQPSIDRSQLEVSILKQVLASAKQKSPADAPSLAAGLVKAEVALALAQAWDDKADAANATLASARADAKTANDPDLDDDVAAAQKDIRVLAERTPRIKAAEDMLQKAQTANDAAAVKIARQKLGLIYLLIDGDVAKAATLLAGTDDANEPAVTALAFFLQDSKRLPASDNFNTLGEALLKTATSAELGSAKVKIASATAGFCKAFLAANPNGLLATKAKLLQTQAEELAGEGPAALLMAKIKENYRPLGAKVEFVHDNVLRFTYDFATKRQANDWEPPNENESWDVGGKEVMSAAPKNQQAVYIINKLRFKADKPLKLSFKASGTSDLTALLYFDGVGGPNGGDNRIYFELGTNNNSVSVIRDNVDRLWTDDKVRIGKGFQKIDITWDGQKSVSYAVNGTAVGKADLKLDQLPRTALGIVLGTVGYAASFDDVVIEGVIVEDPDASDAPGNGSIDTWNSGAGNGPNIGPGNGPNNNGPNRGRRPVRRRLF